MADNNIAIGTTPTISVHIPDVDFETILPDSVRIYIAQSKNVLTKLQNAVLVDIESKTVQTYLTQEETLAYAKGDVDFEVRWLFKSKLPNGDYVAGKTKRMSTKAVDPVIKNEVIT